MKNNYCDGCDALWKKKEHRRSNFIHAFASVCRYYCGAYDNMRLSTDYGKPLKHRMCQARSGAEKGGEE